ncbi:MAG: hypothetical protein ACOCZ2_05140 [Thermodesulfobacteriota bacterium]
MKEMPADTLYGKFFFHPADPVYEQHFPGSPVVPGSLIIKAFLRAMSELGYDCAEVVLQGFRFKKFVKPGSYDYQLQLSEDKVYCSLKSNNLEYVSGVIANAQ